MDMLTQGLLIAALLALVVGQAVLYSRRLRGLQRELSAQTSQVDTLNQRLLATLDALPDLMFEVDLDGRYLDYHSPRKDLLAVAPRDFIGKTLAEVIPGEAASICQSALQEAQQNGYS
ncbi:MAG: PAS domain-containing protein, partial [Polaromonas sp.]|nr:PAS domain-containing protein [Polaromonas sp.]